MNKNQYHASAPGGGVTLVIAGAGTGKTKTLVEKVKNEINSGGYAPEDILILTFSRKAALELKERITGVAGIESAGITAGTFHSFCLDLLKKNADIFIREYGYSDFPRVIDDDARIECIHRLIRPRLELFNGFPLDLIYSLLITLHRLETAVREKLEHTGILKELYSLRKIFQDYKRKKNIIDFDDMMSAAISLLEKCPEVTSKIRKRYRYIFVDEFQDTSRNNFRLLQLLLPENGKNLFVVIVSLLSTQSDDSITFVRP